MVRGWHLSHTRTLQISQNKVRAILWCILCIYCCAALMKKVLFLHAFEEMRSIKARTRMWVLLASLYNHLYCPIKYKMTTHNKVVSAVPVSRPLPIIIGIGCLWRRPAETQMMMKSHPWHSASHSWHPTHSSTVLISIHRTTDIRSDSAKSLINHRICIRAAGRVMWKGSENVLQLNLLVSGCQFWQVYAKS